VTESEVTKGRQDLRVSSRMLPYYVQLFWSQGLGFTKYVAGPSPLFTGHLALIGQAP
jgi:hypothetical protein